MRRLARRLFTLCSALSLVLAVAVCVMWVRSYTVIDSARWEDQRIEPSSLWLAESFNGCLWLCHRSYYFYGATSQLWTSLGTADELSYELKPGNPNGDDGYLLSPPDLRHRWPVFATETNGRDRSTILICPHWALAVLAAVLPTSWVAARWRVRRRALAGLCQRCGYDLRASPERCPECGAGAAA